MQTQKMAMQCCVPIPAGSSQCENPDEKNPLFTIQNRAVALQTKSVQCKDRPAAVQAQKMQCKNWVPKPAGYCNYSNTRRENAHDRVHDPPLANSGQFIPDQSGNASSEHRVGHHAVVLVARRRITSLTAGPDDFSFWRRDGGIFLRLARRV